MLPFVADLSVKNTIVTPSKEPMNQVELLTELADVLVQNGLHNISFEQDGVRVELHAPAPQVLQAAASPVAVAHAPVAAPAEEEDLVTVTSPMVGVFYRSPSPSDPPFVEIGDKVEVGQTVGLVEAMKVFNEIISEAEGIVVSIQAENADLVENGSSLLLLRPVAK